MGKTYINNKKELDRICSEGELILNSYSDGWYAIGMPTSIENAIEIIIYDIRRFNKNEDIKLNIISTSEIDSIEILHFGKRGVENKYLLMRRVKGRHFMATLTIENDDIIWED